MSHIQATYHVVLATKYRLQVLAPAHDRELYKFIYDFSMQIRTFRNGTVGRKATEPSRSAVIM